MFIEPQTSTYADSLQNQNERKTYNYITQTYIEQKIIFDNNIFEQIKGKELDLSVAKIFEIPTMRNWFKRQKEEYYVVSQREHIIDWI